MKSRHDRIRERLRATAPVLDPDVDARRRLPAALSERLFPQAMIPAAVLVPLVDRGGVLHLVLTRRTETLRDHPGQVSFPGGRIEAGDEGPGAAALRETTEELGVPPESVDVVGYLPAQPVISGYAVTPVVGFIAPGTVLRPDPMEVASVIEAPLEFFLVRGNENWGWRRVAMIDLRVMEYRYCDERIWGATAEIIRSFINLIS